MSTSETLILEWDCVQDSSPGMGLHNRDWCGKEEYAGLSLVHIWQCHLVLTIIVAMEKVQWLVTIGCTLITGDYLSIELHVLLFKKCLTIHLHSTKLGLNQIWAVHAVTDIIRTITMTTDSSARECLH